jgi:hypothetical protein
MNKLPFLLAALLGCTTENITYVIVDAGPETALVDAPDARLDVVPDAPVPEAPEVPDASPEAPDAPPEDVPPADAPVPPSPTYKRVFVTSELYNGNMGGFAGADAKCQKLADSAKLGGVYKAWLSDIATDARSRLTHATVDYVLVNGTVVANGWPGLSTPLKHFIDLTEKRTAPPTGNIIAGRDYVWMFTKPDGTKYSTDRNTGCGGWTWAATSPPYGGGLGRASFGLEIKADSVYCDRLAALFCFEQ